MLKLGKVKVRLWELRCIKCIFNMFGMQWIYQYITSSEVEEELYLPASKVIKIKILSKVIARTGKQRQEVGVESGTDRRAELWGTAGQHFKSVDYYSKELLSSSGIIFM